eukprot:5881976-Prymnesium_polylepis.1
MTLAQALPTTAIPESTALLHFTSAPALQQTCTIPASRVRGASACPSRPVRTVADRLSRCRAPRAGRVPAPLSSSPLDVPSLCVELPALAARGLELSAARS